MKRKSITLCFCSLPFFMEAQLNVQQGARMYLQENAELLVQGDINTTDHIQGEVAVPLPREEQMGQWSRILHVRYIHEGVSRRCDLVRCFYVL